MVLFPFSAKGVLCETVELCHLSFESESESEEGCERYVHHILLWVSSSCTATRVSGERSEEIAQLRIPRQSQAFTWPQKRYEKRDQKWRKRLGWIQYTWEKDMEWVFPRLQLPTIDSRVLENAPHGVHLKTMDLVLQIKYSLATSFFERLLKIFTLLDSKNL